MIKTLREVRTASVWKTCRKSDPPQAENLASEILFKKKERSNTMYQKVDTNMNFVEREKKVRKNSGQIIISSKKMYGAEKAGRNLYVL